MLPMKSVTILTSKKRAIDDRLNKWIVLQTLIIIIINIITTRNLDEKWWKRWKGQRCVTPTRTNWQTDKLTKKSQFSRWTKRHPCRLDGRTVPTRLTRWRTRRPARYTDTTLHVYIAMKVGPTSSSLVFLTNTQTLRVVLCARLDSNRRDDPPTPFLTLPTQATVPSMYNGWWMRPTLTNQKITQTLTCV